jgi:hypothetical protein
MFTIAIQVLAMLKKHWMHAGKTSHKLVNYINANSAGNAVLLTGDWNCRYTRTGDNIRLVTSDAGATDPWIQMIKNGDCPNSRFRRLNVPRFRHCYRFQCEIVDKIFYRSNNFITLNPLEFTYEDANFPRRKWRNAFRPPPRFHPLSIYVEQQPENERSVWWPTRNWIITMRTTCPASPKVATIGMRAGSRVDQVNLTLTNGTTFIHGGTGGTSKSLTLGTQVNTLNPFNCVLAKYNNKTRIFYCKFTTSTAVHLKWWFNHQ